jgi:carboxylesterase
VKNAHFLASRVSSADVDTFYVDDTYHVLTLDKRKDDVAARVAEFFLRIGAPAALPVTMNLSGA